MARVKKKASKKAAKKTRGTAGRWSLVQIQQLRSIQDNGGTDKILRSLAKEWGRNPEKVIVKWREENNMGNTSTYSADTQGGHFKMIDYVPADELMEAWTILKPLVKDLPLSTEGKAIQLPERFKNPIKKLVELAFPKKTFVFYKDEDNDAKVILVRKK